jgi:hypothetical protein
MNETDADRLPWTAAGLSLIASPVLALLSALLFLTIGSTEGAQLRAIAAHPDRWYWSTILLVASIVLLVPAYVGLAALVRRSSRRLGATGGALAILGVMVATGDAMSQLMGRALVAADADRAQMVALLVRFDDDAGANAVFNVGGLAIIVGSLLLTAGLIRGRVVPVWSAVALSAAVVLNIAGYGAASGGLVAASYLVMLAGFAHPARVILRTARAGESPRRAPAQPTGRPRHAAAPPSRAA